MNSATRATDLANGCRHLGHPGDVLGLHYRAGSSGLAGHRAGQHVDVRLTAEDGYTAEREYSIASAPGEPLAITVERWWGLEATAYLYIAFVAVPSVLAAVHTGRPQTHQRTRFAPVLFQLSRATMSPKRSARSQRVQR